MSRRVFLAHAAAASALATVPTGVVARGDGDDADDEAGNGEDADDAEADGDEGAGDDDQPEVVVDFEPPDLPENMAVDDEGNVYVSLAVTGEIRRVAPDGSESTVATLDLGEGGILLGIVMGDDGIYAAAGTGDPDTHGVWRVGLDDEGEGESELVASLPAEETMPNGILHAPDGSGALLVTDHLGGAIWRVTPEGEAEPWLDHPLLDPNPYADSQIGADGIAVHPDGDVYVDNLNFGGLVRVPVEDGDAGEPEVFLQDDALIGADGMTFDADGNLYVAVNAANEVVRVTPDTEIETIASGGDLDFPADVIFGTGEASTTLYICNFAIGTFQEDEAAANPSLMRIDVGAEGFHAGERPGDGAGVGDDVDEPDEKRDDDAEDADVDDGGEDTDEGGGDDADSGNEDAGDDEYDEE